MNKTKFLRSFYGFGKVRILCFVFFLFFTSCALLRIESEQKPLSINDLNTRLLTQSFVTEAMRRTENTADSIAKLALGDIEIQKNALLWKIKTGEELKRIGFQTSPKVALTDVWSYMLEVQDLFGQIDSLSQFGPYQPAAIRAASQNAAEIENIARSVLSTGDFMAYQAFVTEYAKAHPLTRGRLEHQTIKQDFLRFRDVPDSLGIQTVGTLSEVVADVSNKVDFSSDILGKQLKWHTELWMKEKGMDSIEFQKRVANFNVHVDRLLAIAENSPETLKKAIVDFVEGVDPLFKSLNHELGMAMLSLSEDRAAIDSMVKRERMALDSIIKRERLALAEEARTIAEIGVKNTMMEVRKTISTTLFYLLLIIIAVLGIPFYLGFLLGKNRKEKTK
ncbi:hypothetical protein [Ulvibacterium sp.]|uniref:hypothetical protein n=1 Tax=Ulvibacterium sp. TaxID=2665914 RepID=UPI00261C19DA|nr:hypothetical protein [Ulvibacterium sp.]